MRSALHVPTPPTPTHLVSQCIASTISRCTKTSHLPHFPAPPRAFAIAQSPRWQALTSCGATVVNPGAEHDIPSHGSTTRLRTPIKPRTPKQRQSWLRIWRFQAFVAGDKIWERVLCAEKVLCVDVKLGSWGAVGACSEDR